MDADNRTKNPILEVAWTRYAQLDLAALRRSKSHMRLRRWIAILGILATLFAILTEAYSASWSPLGSQVIKVALILTPILGSVLAAFFGKFFGSGDHLILRSGAEEILKEIYSYRTILNKSLERRDWLEKRVADIQRQVYRGLGGELVLKDYPEKVPPYYDEKKPESDPGFSDLTGEQYFHYRLENQLAWHMVKVNQVNGERIRLAIFILIAGGAGAFLAAMGGAFSLWVALSSSFAAALVGWQELRNLDFIVKNYSKVIVELGIIYDHWTGLEPEERTEVEFHKMVQTTEGTLWSQFVEYIQSMQDALAKADLDEEADLIKSVVKRARESDARLKKAMRDSVVQFTSTAMTDSEKAASTTFQAVLGTLAEEANTELVLQELEAMGQAVAEKVEEVKQRAVRLADSLEDIAAEFAHIEIGKETPSKVLFDMISRYPKNENIKG